jgi:hypothetical protein
MAGSGAIQIRIAAYRIFARGYEFCYPVTFRHDVCGGREHLDYCGVVCSVIQARVNGRLVWLEAIGTHVEPPWRCGVSDLGNEILSVNAVPFPEVPR